MTDGNRLTPGWSTSAFGHLVMWTYPFGRPHGHLDKLGPDHVDIIWTSWVRTMWTSSGQADVDTPGRPFDRFLNQVRRASPLSNCQRLDYPTALDLAKFLREQFPRVVRGAVTLVNNMAQTGPLRGVEEEFTRQP